MVRRRQRLGEILVFEKMVWPKKRLDSLKCRLIFATKLQSCKLEPEKVWVWTVDVEGLCVKPISNVSKESAMMLKKDWILPGTGVRKDKDMMQAAIDMHYFCTIDMHYAYRWKLLEKYRSHIQLMDSMPPEWTKQAVIGRKSKSQEPKQLLKQSKLRTQTIEISSCSTVCHRFQPQARCFNWYYSLFSSCLPLKLKHKGWRLLIAFSFPYCLCGDVRLQKHHELHFFPASMDNLLAHRACLLDDLNHNF